MTPAEREAYARANSNLLHVASVEFLHPSFMQPLRVVDYDRDLSLPLELTAPMDAAQSPLFTGWDCEIQPPDIDSEVDAITTIQIDGVSGVVHALLANASKSSYPIAANIRFYSVNVASQEVSGPVGVIYQEVRSVTTNSSTVSVACGYTNSANKAFPSQKYTSHSNPGLVS